MADQEFKDLFSEQSSNYMTFRPRYPEEVFRWLSEQTLSHDLAWDCGTGNGQAAVQLAKYYSKVIATDPSSEQLKFAMPSEQIEYRRETAEHSSLQDSSIDVVCVAQALHWFNFDAFYQEVKRVLKPGGLICAIAYGLPETEQAILEHIRQLHDVTLRTHWDQERQLVANLYLDIPFPFHKIDAPTFQIAKELNQKELCGYLQTWSGLKKMLKSTGQDPMPDFRNKLEKLWPSGRSKVVFTWKLALLVGKT